MKSVKAEDKSINIYASDFNEGTTVANVKDKPNSFVIGEGYDYPVVNLILDHNYATILKHLRH